MNLYQTIIGFKHPYDYEQEDTLFAIGFSLGRYKEDADSELPSDYPIRGENEDEDIFNKRLNEYLDGKGIELLKSEGMYTVVYDNPNDSSVIIAATPKELYRLFASEDSIFNDWIYSICPVIRFDFIDIVKELGWKEENRDLYEWCQDNKELLQAQIGEEPHVTMTVEVEKP